MLLTFLFITLPVSLKLEFHWFCFNLHGMMIQIWRLNPESSIHFYESAFVAESHRRKQTKQNVRWVTVASNRLLPPIPADWWWHTPPEPLTGRLGGHVGWRVATFNRCESLSWVAGGHPVGGWGVAGVSRCPPPLSRAPLDLPTYQLPLFRVGGAFVGGQGGKLNSNLTWIFKKMF
jgi:hypothetical protein